MQLPTECKEPFARKEPCFDRKMESEIKLNFEHLSELVTPETNSIWRMQYFF